MEEQQKTVTKIEPKGFSQQEGQFKIRVAAYCRVSSDSMDQENSFAAQVKYFTDMLNKNKDFQIVDIYADDAVSGRSTTKRDDFNRLIEDCKKRTSGQNNNKIGFKICTKHCRLLKYDKTAFRIGRKRVF